VGVILLIDLLTNMVTILATIFIFIGICIHIKTYHIDKNILGFVVMVVGFIIWIFIIPELCKYPEYYIISHDSFIITLVILIILLIYR